MGILQLILKLFMMCLTVPLVKQVENLIHGISFPMGHYTVADVPFHAVVVCVARRQSETNIRIEFFETEGGGGLCCVVIVVFGVLYLWYVFISPPIISLYIVCNLRTKNL